MRENEKGLIYILGVRFAEKGNTVKYQKGKISVQSEPYPNSVCMSTDLSGLSGKMKVLTNCFWLYTAFWNTIHYTTDWNTMFNISYIVCSLRKLEQGVSNILKQLISREWGLTKASNSRLITELLIQLSKLRWCHFFWVPKVPEYEVKQILWDTLIPNLSLGKITSAHIGNLVLGQNRWLVCKMNNFFFHE